MARLQLDRAINFYLEPRPVRANDLSVRQELVTQLQSVNDWRACLAHMPVTLDGDIAVVKSSETYLFRLSQSIPKSVSMFITNPSYRVVFQSQVFPAKLVFPSLSIKRRLGLVDSIGYEGKIWWITDSPEESTQYGTAPLTQKSRIGLLIARYLVQVFGHRKYGIPVSRKIVQKMCQASSQAHLVVDRVARWGPKWEEFSKYMELIAS